MLEQSVIIYPDSRLLQKSQLITVFNADLKILAKKMLQIMSKHDGVGLAAPQIGINSRIFVMDLNQKDGAEKSTPLVCVNPAIKESSGTIIYEEGCLSLPGIREKIQRKKQIVFSYQDLEGNVKLLTKEDLAAVCIQHEIDHLNGILIIHKLNSLKRKLVLSKYKKQLEYQK